MLTIPPRVKVFVCLQDTDMRRGFPGLSGEVKSTLAEDPLSGHLFLFRNRRRDRIKILFWDGDGYVIFYKQLARGSFEFPEANDPQAASVQIRASELAMLLDGIELRGRRRRPRYEHLAGKADCSTQVHRVA